eukprot:scaffold7204_cov102-Isochrysis_galbana.AAC.2
MAVVGLVLEHRFPRAVRRLEHFRRLCRRTGEGDGGEKVGRVLLVGVLGGEHLQSRAAGS